MTDDRLILAKVLYWLMMEDHRDFLYQASVIAERMELPFKVVWEALEALSRAGLIEVSLNGGISPNHNPLISKGQMIVNRTLNT